MRASALAMFFLLVTSAFSMPALAEVVINEIHPWGKCEWIELYNTDNESISIGGWVVYTKPSRLDAKLPQNSSIPSGGFFVLGTVGCGADYEKNITLTDNDTFVELRNSENLSRDLVNLGNAFYKSKTENKSIQRIDPNLSLSNETGNWLIQSPTNGSENFPTKIDIEILSLLIPKNIFVNQTVSINVSILNKGVFAAENRTLFLNSTSGSNFSWDFNISGLSAANISFNWTPAIPGNFTWCAFAENASNCNESEVILPPEKFANLTIWLNNSLLAGKEYDSLFKIAIENKSKIEGSCSGKDNITVTYNISDFRGNYNFLSNFTVEVGCNKTADTGRWTPLSPGNYTLCGKIINSTSKFSNEIVCKNISAFNSQEVLCNLSIAVESKNILADGEKDEYNLTVIDSLGNCNGSSVEINYRIEDLSGNALGGYPKATNKTVGVKNSFSFTPSLDCGKAVYRLRANITNASCNDTTLQDNSAEVLINVTGKTAECETATPTKVAKKTSSGGGGGSISISAPEVDPIDIKILDLAGSVVAGEEFSSKVLLKNNCNYLVSAKLYSYAYDGKSCITGSWTANQQDIFLEAGEARVVDLKNLAELSAIPGEYIFRARVKIGEKEYDEDSKISVTASLNAAGIPSDASLSKEVSGRETNLTGPELKIWNDTKLRINLTNCDGCTMIISGPGGLNNATDKKYRVFDKMGSYNVLVMRNGSMIINQTYNFTKEILPEVHEINPSSSQDEPLPEKIPTGEFAKVSQSGGIFGRITDAIGNFFSYLFGLMTSSIAR